jgi:serine/threonine protein kinase
MESFALIAVPNSKTTIEEVTEVEDQSLADYLNTTSHIGKIPSPAEIVHILMPIAAALDSARQRGELHGALKPDVILLDTHRATSSSPGEPTLSNFGMHQKQDLQLQSPYDVAYVAPEVAQGQPATSRSDLYSLGVILYELCTGALPFQGETANDILMQQLQSAPISPALINPHIRPALTAVIMRSLARDPSARFSSATALVTAAARAMNVSVPENTDHSKLAPTVVNPSSVGDINDPNTPTYLIPSPVSQAGSPPPTVASGNAPAVSRSPVNPSTTPVLPPTSTGGIPRVQPPVNVTPVPQQVSGSYPVLSTSGPMPVTPSVSPPSRPAQRSFASFSAPTNLTRKRRISVLAALALLLVAVLLVSGVLLYLTSIPASSPSSAVVGHAFFLSSGLISTKSNQGTTDGLRISLQNINDPASGKRYYGWLTSSGTDLPIALGPLSVNHGKIVTTYTDPNHNNLLAHYGRFLITEENANQQPTNPSLDAEHDWRYYSEFSTVPSQTDPSRFNVLDHLRHLLAQDPKLEKVGLQGGLSVWLFRNTTKILEAAGSARDIRKQCTENVPQSCDTGLILRQVARILDYLDGAKYVGRENIPPGIQSPDHLLIDSNVAQVALLEFDPVNQQPPGYLQHIGRHLEDLTQTPGVTAGQRTLADRINRDINNVQGWLDVVHADASKLIQMSPDDLVQPDALTTLNDLFTQANSAFVGHVDPNTNIAKEGVVQIYYNIQALATFDVAPCTTNNGQSSCTGGGNR